MKLRVIPYKFDGLRMKECLRKILWKKKKKKNLKQKINSNKSSIVAIKTKQTDMKIVRKYGMRRLTTWMQTILLSIKCPATSSVPIFTIDCALKSILNHLNCSYLWIAIDARPLFNYHYVFCQCVVRCDVFGFMCRPHFVLYLFTLHREQIDKKYIALQAMSRQNME